MNFYRLPSFSADLFVYLNQKWNVLMGFIFWPRQLLTFVIEVQRPRNIRKNFDKEILKNL